ncbi:endonuclease/exonuclease/phosphatase family protein [Bacillus sp. FJAT-49732]|uniref:Endonuclease/exonuclease/phosphatase family protein n=2 Tax=Lederbergia citrisecunda TaxID=2833583 RepID=A0A942TT44_9BACI|nr:endonuclease/exonuclease/phosphatase family protein [Lederbergia citrisecunda]
MLKIKAMTFNIHHGKGMDKLTDLYRIANIIDQCGADVIALNEVDSHFSKRSLFEDQAGWLANELNMDYAFSPSIFKKDKNLQEPRQYGNALLSRHPIIAKESHLFKISRLTEGRSLLETKIQIQKCSLKMAVTHLSLNPIIHRKQTDVIIGRYQKNTNPTILMGDWNMKPGSKGWEKITKEFQDVWEEAGKGSGYTYPSFQPRSRLDYIFASRDFEIIHAEVVNKVSEASDHLPVVATLYYRT